MKATDHITAVVTLIMTQALCIGQSSKEGAIGLKDNWEIQSTAVVKEKGEVISTTAYKTEKWYPATVPSTVLGTLVENKVFPDPYYGTNIESLPGYTNDRRIGMPENSPFRSSWWYRTVVQLPEDIVGRLTWLKFHSINYRANIWLNGHLIADTTEIEGAIREITSWMNNFDNKHTRVFQINGKNMVIRGGGYVEDMMLRPSDKRVDIDIMYAKYMGLNALRMEAPRGSDHLFEKCDEEGILLMVGWCCCSSWERWKNWTPHIADIAEKSWRDQIVHLRNHPSVFDWLYGSDNFPPADVEKRYIQVLNEFDGTRPYQSSATKDSSEIAGNTGLYMGPYPMVYAYMPPSYWYGKLEFNTEAGPAGEQIAPMESMRKMMPEGDLWPISKSWDLRLHKAFYPPARKALESRYGKPGSLEEYSVKSQVLQLEATRAMFEAYAGNKYRSSGWLSAKGDEKADFTALNTLPKVKLNCHLSGGKQADGRFKLTIDMENASHVLAFSINPKILKSKSRDLVLPVYWEDNYFSLLPGEKRTLVVEFNDEDLAGEKPLFMVDGWNIEPVQLNIP